jgi:hypothetical protein
MDNVQKLNNFNNKQQSQNFKSYIFLIMIEF